MAHHPAKLILALCLGLLGCASGPGTSGPKAGAGADGDGQSVLSDSDASSEAGATALADGGAVHETSTGQIGLDGSDAGVTTVADSSVSQDTGGGQVGALDAAGPGGADASAKMDTPMCQTKLSQYQQLQAKALSCDTPFQCTQLGPEGLGCPCQRYYSIKTFDYQNLADVSAEALKKGCKQSCTPEPCPPKVFEVGVCESGGCIDYNATCSELDDMAALAVQAGLACTTDAQCVFGANNDLTCGCSQYLNMNTMGPGKPLFWYMLMLVKAYNAKGCGAGVECACPQPQSAVCEKGVCVTKFKDVES